MKSLLKFTVKVAGIKLRQWFADQAEVVKRLPETMTCCGVEDTLTKMLTARIDTVSRMLADARPRSQEGY